MDAPSVERRAGEERFTIEVAGLPVEVVRKPIQNLHLAVYPPDGRVRLAVPQRVSDDAARLAVVNHLGWIRRQRADFARQPRQSAREMVAGESHYVWGRRRKLTVIHHDGPSRVVVRGASALDLYIRPQADAVQREAALAAWYRAEVKARVPALVEAWEPVLGVEVAAWGVKRMRTKWGSCNTAARRIWLNSELAKKPPECLEFVVVHEMVHLLERLHTDRFRALMDHFLPTWRVARSTLNRAPLAHEDWTY